jgi:hypothetical protein
MRNQPRFKLFCFSWVVIVFWLSPIVRADSPAYFDVAIAKLHLTDGTLPAPVANTEWQAIARQSAMPPYVVLDGPGEAVVSGSAGQPFSDPSAGRVLVRTPDDRQVTGRLFVAKTDATSMIPLRFSIDAPEAKDANREPFYRALESHYESLVDRNLPGGAWFRHRAHEAAEAAGKPLDDNDPNRIPRTAAGSLDDTFALFTGSQALAENLQLDRVLPPRGKQDAPATMDIASLKGLEVAELDWKPLVKDLKPELDPLASSIPADQHAIFFPDFAALLALADEADQQGTPVLQFANQRSEDARTRQRYERQLGLSLSGLARLIGPQFIQSVAITGSDPFLRSGGDVAILFQSKNATTLHALLAAQIGMSRKTISGSTGMDGSIGSLKFTGATSPDRALNVYLALIGEGTVVLTNSIAQIESLAAVADRKAPALSTLPEYTFFRNRYKRGEGDETALVVLSDAAIRRWCSPRWRIADSRRIRAAAVLANLNAEHLDQLVTGKLEAGPVHTDLYVPDLGEMRMTSRGVVSPTYGSFDALRPVSEIKIDKVTQAEADTYNRWRDTYQSNWRNYFDPIALRFSVREKRLGADLTVMPLIWGSEYRPMVEIARGAKIDPASGDPHADMLSRISMAININAPQIRAASAFALANAPGVKVDPLGWLGQSVTLFCDDSPFWAELAKAANPEEFLEKNWARMPVGLRAEVSNGLKLTAFLVAVHGFIDQSGPGMTVWENLSYKNQPYVKITPSEQAKGQNKELENVAIFYHASGDSLLITPNEELLKRALDRQSNRDAARKDGKPLPDVGQPLLGSSLVLQADARLLELTPRDEIKRALQELAWGNLPILNEWKRRYPDEDPQMIHERFFQTRLLDPAGAQYVWNEQLQTMESAVYGSPAQPKEGPATLNMLHGILRGNFGVTFENDGLRARVELDRGGNAEPSLPNPPHAGAERRS